jgi:hypothetical protein
LERAAEGERVKAAREAEDERKRLEKAAERAAIEERERVKAVKAAEKTAEGRTW